jgi:YD repeat-containing protein
VLGQVDRLTSDYGTGTVYVDATTYDSTGDLIQQLLGDTGAQVARDLDWDEATGRLDTLTTTAGVDTMTPATVQEDTYLYDPAGNVTSITDENSGQAQCFIYDTLRRLVEAWTTVTSTCNSSPSSQDVDGPDAYWYTWTFSTGMAHSVKSRDLQKSYPNGSRLAAQLKRDVDALADWGGQSSWGGVPIPGSAVKQRKLWVGVTSGWSQGQHDAMVSAFRYAQSRGVQIEFVVVK